MKTMKAQVKKIKEDLEKQSKHFATLVGGITRKRMKTLERLSGLRKNTSRKPTNKMVSRIKMARNAQVRAHRMETVQKSNSMNKLISALKNMKIKGGATRKRCGY